MNIDSRLRSLINEIQGQTLVDVGCDHGKVTWAALTEGRVQRAIACDISDKSLDKARALAKKEDLKNVEFRCGDGLSVIKNNEADLIVIAGMGGREIIKILSNRPSGIEKLVLCPHTEVINVREFLSSNNFYIEKDYVVKEDKHFYSVIVAIADKEDKLSEKEMLLGKDNKNNSIYVMYLDYLLDKYTKLLEKGITGENKERYEKYLEIIKKEINEG